METTSYSLPAEINGRRLRISAKLWSIGEFSKGAKLVITNRHSYRIDLLDRLKDLAYAQLYLDAAAKESQETLLLALRDVAEAQKGMAQVAAESDLNRENLYRALSEDGNPRLSTLGSVLDALGMVWGISLKHAAQKPGQRRSYRRFKKK